MDKKLAELSGFDLSMINLEKEVQCEDVSTLKISKKKPEDGEIGVFEAEKYFNGDMDSDTSPKVVSKANPEFFRQPTNEEITVYHRRNSAKKYAGTPSLHSESSWLQNKFTKNSSCNSLQTKSSSSKTVKKSLLAILGCRCMCSDANLIDIDENGSMKKGYPGFSVQETATGTVMNSPVRKIHALKGKNSPSVSADLNSKLKLHPQEEEIQRKSLEVFGSPVLEKRAIKKKLEIIPRDLSSPKTEEHGFSVKYEEEESGSDASSDLFEIESLKGKSKSLAKQGSHPASPICYAPSEASVEWSVVTASAADFSVFSECVTNPVRKTEVSIPKNPNPKWNRESTQRQKSSSGLLLSCRSKKAVRVSGNSYRTMSNTTSDVPRFTTETRPISHDSRKRINGSSISHSHNLLYV